MAPKKAVAVTKKGAAAPAVEDIYVKYDQITHVRERPGMYIGSIEEDQCEVWTIGETDGATKMVKKTVKYIPGLYKIFDEILVNAGDHVVRLLEKPAAEVGNYVKNIRVKVDKKTGVIEVTNDGDGIDIALHAKENIYIPELIFANMLSSSNYDNNAERIVGGQNGIGGKATNIFSQWFEVETVDAVRQLHYIQRYENGMTVINKPKITKCKKKPYTTIRFLPNFSLFKGAGGKSPKGISDDMYLLMEKRVYDMCAVTGKDVTVYWNDKKLDYKNFEKYVDLYLGDKKEQVRVYEQINDRWEIAASYNDFNGFEQISFVNGIWTLRGGKHVEYIVNQIVKKLTELITKKNKNVVIKPQAVKDNLFIFVKSVIVNPMFDSQSKETLTTPVAKFGSKAEVSDKFIEKLYKSGIVDKILEISALHGQKELKKTDGQKKKTLRGIPKLDDANWAGTDKSQKCTLILTEGDSAKTMAIAGLSQVGRDAYGVFPLRGKLMNVKDATDSKISENAEMANLKKILGLKNGEKYKTLDDLRYGKIMIMVDSDYDGSHIKGLIFNMFHSLWPSLMKDQEHFLTCMLTPIVKVTKGSEVVSFYTMSDFEEWVRGREGDVRGWKIKYYKGLGTSTEQEAIEYFRQLKTVDYKHNGKASDDALDLAFNKKRADDRKEWLGVYDKNAILDSAEKTIFYDEFVHRELKHFSNYDLERSIPNINDGFKTSIRKIAFGCFKKGIYDKEIKVAQLAGYVSENAAYHHGEASLQGAIVGMAQDFVGSNNINLLMPIGQFGSRVQGGSDASQPRYIFTKFEPIVNAIFKKEDMKLLNYRVDDGDEVEPDYYMPVVPMVLINGALGIGTGFSTNVPCFNPKEIVRILREKLRGETPAMDLAPWYCGFRGNIVKDGDTAAKDAKWQSTGCFERINSTQIRVTELPVGFWTEDFKVLLEKILDEKNTPLKGYDSNYTHTHVDFTLHFNSGSAVDALMKTAANGFTEFENKFKLVKTKGLGTNNMYLFNSDGQIKKYDTVGDIIDEYYVTRLKYYGLRKEKVLQELENDIAVKENRIRFIQETIAKVIDVSSLTKKELEDTLEKREYMKVEKNGTSGGYNYLIEIPIYKQTKDEVDKLNGEIETCRNKHEEITKKTKESMWMDDLNEFDKAYDTYYNARLAAMNDHKTATTKKKAVSSTTKRVSRK
jgi:DNA topoisomerase-2